MAIAKNTICLWYDKDAEAAARFYAETFPDSSVNAVIRAPGDYPSGKQGNVLLLTVDGEERTGHDIAVLRDGIEHHVRVVMGAIGEGEAAKLTHR